MGDLNKTPQPAFICSFPPFPFLDLSIHRLIILVFRPHPAVPNAKVHTVVAFETAVMKVVVGAAGHEPQDAVVEPSGIELVAEVGFDVFEGAPDLHGREHGRIDRDPEGDGENPQRKQQRFQEMERHGGEGRDVDAFVVLAVDVAVDAGMVKKAVHPIKPSVIDE